MADEGEMVDGPEVSRRPDPDPTTRTIQSSQRETGHLQELLEMQLTCQKEITELTTEGLHRERDLLRQVLSADMEGSRKVLEAELEGDRKVNALQFILSERQRVEQKEDTKTAVDAALSAQKEAVREQTAAFGLATSKSELNITKQLEQLAQLTTASTAAVSGSVSDLKDRVGAIENVKVGGQQAYAGLYVLAGLVLAAVTTIVAVLIATSGGAGP